MRARWLGTLLPFLLLVLPARLAWGGVTVADFAETDVVTGLSQPTAIAFLPDGRLLVTQQGGALLLVSSGVATPLATIPTCFALIDPVQEVETGLLGVAPHPAFPAERSIFLYRSRTTATEPCDDIDLFGREIINEVVRVTLAADDSVSLASLTVLLTGISAESGYHNGGTLRIGPDEKLYVSIGDANAGTEGPPGSATSPYPQDLGVLEGKILRLNLDGTAPADNPFAGQAGARREIFALGFRNPFRMSFDPVTGRLWAGDVGLDAEEEIDLVTAGGRYAWPHCEGSLPAGCHQASDTAPVFSYPHMGAGALGNSVIGGVFPRGGALAAFGSHYLFADFGEGSAADGEIYAAPLDAARMAFAGAPEAVVTQAGGPVDLVIGPDGALYYVAYIEGAVRRVSSTRRPPPGSCASIADCQAELDGARPSPDAAAAAKSRKVARQIAKLDGKADKQLAKAGSATGSKQVKAYKKARQALAKLLAAARKADAKGRLGVALAALEVVVNRLVGLIPT